MRQKDKMKTNEKKRVNMIVFSKKKRKNI